MSEIRTSRMGVGWLPLPPPSVLHSPLSDMLPPRHLCKKASTYSRSICIESYKCSSGKSMPIWANPSVRDRRDQDAQERQPIA